MEKQRLAFQEYISGTYCKAFENMPFTTEVMQQLQLNYDISLQIISSLRVFHPILDLFETAKQKGLLLKQEYPKELQKRKSSIMKIDELIENDQISDESKRYLFKDKERLSPNESVKKRKYNQILESKYLFLWQEMTGLSPIFQRVKADGQTEEQEIIQRHIGGMQQPRLSDSELQEKIDRFYSMPLDLGTKSEKFYFKTLQCLIYKLLRQADIKKRQAREHAANIIKTALKELLPDFPSYHSLTSKDIEHSL